MQISPHFDDSEFECKCGCGFREVSKDLLDTLETIRSWYDKPIIITSGCRCSKHNRAVGGAKNSYHIWGLAADFYIPGEDMDMVADRIDAAFPDTLGLGRYGNRVHLDVRKKKARWDG